MLRFLAGSSVLLLALAAGVSFSVLGEPLSAVAAQQALQRNAVAWRGVAWRGVAWDVRGHTTSSLPGAVAIDRASLDRWLARSTTT